jgi:hypothetical protein
VGKAESKSKAPKPLKSMKDSTGSPNGHHWQEPNSAGGIVPGPFLLGGTRRKSTCYFKFHLNT